MISITVVCLGTLFLAAATAGAIENEFDGQRHCQQDSLFQQVYRPQILRLAPDVNRIIAHVTEGPRAGRTYRELANLVDRFGSRLTGTENLERAIDYVQERLRRDQHDHVSSEPVSVPRWSRGNEWLEMVEPRRKRMPALGLGYSVGTGGKVLEAPVLVVRNFSHLEQRASEVPGKVVVYNFDYVSYGAQNQYRTNGASRAARYGAVAALIRSLTPFSIGSPHTGMMQYESNGTQIPGVSITVEDAHLLQRLVDRGETVVVRLYSENRLDPEPGVSRNTISDVRGSGQPDQYVMVSGHIDSWDVGQGAMDDGAGAVLAWRALSVVKELGLKPYRTMRSILWTGEEMGLLGAHQFVERHRDQLSRYLLAMESDIGTFRPLGLSYSGQNRTGQCVMWQVLQLLAPLNATRLRISDEGSDVTELLNEGVPIASLDTENERYFYFHHTEGDTMTVENEQELDQCLAVWTATAYVLATIEAPLPSSH